MNRYAIDHARGRIVLQANTREQALLKAASLFAAPTKLTAFELPKQTPATTATNTMSKTTNTAPAVAPKKKAAKPPKKGSIGEAMDKIAAEDKAVKKTLGERVDKAAAPKKGGKQGMSALSAAAEVLKGAKDPMNAVDIVAAIQKKGLAPGLKGKTPHATIYAGMITEIAKKGNEARFERVDKGLFKYHEPKAAK
jgi:hypothetical protein